MARSGDRRTDEVAESDPHVQTHIVERPEMDDVRPSYRVVEAVAELTGTPPEKLTPLYDVIDSDALDGLFDHDTHGTPIEDGYLQFRYEGCDVTVYADGRTVVSLVDDEA
jgi:hypothetical protein